MRRAVMGGVAMPMTMVRSAMMPMLGSLELSSHEHPAAAGPHDLPVGHAMASAHHAPGDVHGLVVLMGSAVVLAAGAVVRAGRMVTRGMMVRAARVMVAHVDPAVTRSRSRHRREWRQRWRLRLRPRARLRCFRHRLLGRRGRLVRAGLLRERRLLLGRDLLRCDGRSEDRQREHRAAEGDTLQ